jgi:hypothetical protein
MGYTQLLGRYAATESDASARTVGEEGERRVNVDVDEDGAQLDGETLPENDLMEASEESEVVDEADADVDELLDTSAALESFLVSASVARKQGGWTTQEAAAYGLGLDAVLGRIGAKASDAMPAVESFSSSRERQNSTAAVENRVTEILKTIWEAIKNSVNKVIVFVRRWYLKIVDGASRLKKRAEAIRKKAENTTGSKKESKIRGPLAGLHINKAMPTAEMLKTKLGDVKGIIETTTKGKMASNYGDLLEGAVTTLEKLADGEDATLDFSKLGSAAGIGGTAFKTADNLKGKFPGAPDYGNAFGTDELPGGKRAAFVSFGNALNSGNSDAKAINTIARFVGKVLFVDSSDKQVEIDSTKEVATLEPSQVAGLADGVIDLCDVVIDYKKDFENYERKTKETLSKVDKIANGSKKGDNDAESAKIAKARALANFTGAAIRNQGTSITTIINYAMNLGRNVLVYGNSSLSQYKD